MRHETYYQNTWCLKYMLAFHFPSRELLNAWIDYKAWWQAGNAKLVVPPEAWQMLVRPACAFGRGQNKMYEHLIHYRVFWRRLLKTRKLSTHLAFDLGRVVLKTDPIARRWKKGYLMQKNSYIALVKRKKNKQTTKFLRFCETWGW